MASDYLNAEQQARVSALAAARDLLYPKQTAQSGGGFNAVVYNTTPVPQWWPLIQTAAFIMTGDTLIQEEDTE